MTEAPKLLPCRKCGRLDNISEWDGRGTQAEMWCECGEHEGVQVIDLIDTEMRFAPGNEFNMETLRYPDEFVLIARTHLHNEWNTRPNSQVKLDGSQPSESAVEALHECLTQTVLVPSINSLSKMHVEMIIDSLAAAGYHLTPIAQERQTLTDEEAEIAIKGALIEDEWGDCIDYEGLVARLAAQGIKLTKEGKE